MRKSKEEIYTDVVLDIQKLCEKIKKDVSFAFFIGQLNSENYYAGLNGYNDEITDMISHWLVENPRLANMVSQKILEGLKKNELDGTQ